MRNPIASVADLHARGKDLDWFYRQWNAACYEIRRRNPRLVLIAGDVWESPTIGDASSMVDDVLAAVLAPIVEHLCEVRIVAIPGNHDIAADSAQNALAGLAALPNVTVARTPQKVSVDDVDVFCIPWSWGRENGTAEKQASDLLANNPRLGRFRILVSHANVSGGRMNCGRVCDGGQWCFSRGFLESLDVDRVVLGDFHARNMFLAGPGRGGYVGALRQCNHGEEGNPQGFELWEPESNLVEWIELCEYPVHKTVVLAPGNEPPSPSPNLRVRTAGFVLDAVQTKAIQDAGGKVETLREKEERIQRADIPADNLTDYGALLDAYVATLTDAPVDVALCRAELDDELTSGSLDVESEPDDEIEIEAIQAAF